MDPASLSEREAIILNAIVRDYVVTAEPTGSRTISKQGEVNLSPASIRIILADLEEKGMVSQPHTSAGRIPTDKGYRFYVDNLVDLAELSNQEKEGIESQIEMAANGFEEVANVTCRMLSSLSQELGVVLAPRFYEGLFRKLEIVEIADNKTMLILSIKSGLVNTIMVEMKTEYKGEVLQNACEFINERLSGKKLSDIKGNLQELIQTDDEAKLGIVRMFTQNAEDRFNFSDDKTIHTGGATQLLVQPEFSEKDRLEAVVEMVENKNTLIHLFDKRDLKKGVFVTIGGENSHGELSSYSVVTSSYTVGNVRGTLGIVGPTRMPYPKLISVVDYTAKVLSKKL